MPLGDDLLASTGREIFAHALGRDLGDVSVRGAAAAGGPTQLMAAALVRQRLARLRLRFGVWAEASGFGRRQRDAGRRSGRLQMHAAFGQLYRPYALSLGYQARRPDRPALAPAA